MSYLDTDILISNINKLMGDKNISQARLAEILGMSQPNVSKALNPKEKKCFTLAQIYDLARYFKISIDELVGNVRGMNASISPRSTAAFITKLAEAHDIDFIPYTRTECVFTPDFDPQTGYPDYNRTNQEVTYPTILLRSYWSVDEAKNEEEAQELWAEATQIGNDTAMNPVNKYLEQFQEIFKIYEKGDLSKQTYETVIADLLSHLRE